MSADMHDRIDRLLHDAEHAESGMLFALQMARMQPGNPEHARASEDLARKRAALLQKALDLDPERTAPAWEETDLDLPRREFGR